MKMTREMEIGVRGNGRLDIRIRGRRLRERGQGGEVRGRGAGAKEVIVILGQI